jgi:23S rRNA (cytosine1962-C5)-methyltransferase
MHQADLVTSPFKDYEILDSGDNRKLERYGEYVLIRPETQALWRPLRPELWKNAHAEFAWKGKSGEWRVKGVPESWDFAWEDARASLRLTSFKHTGVFPEQASNWKWIAERISALKSPKVLNLFAYTGVASIVACQAGASVTHVDSSKQSNAWAKENAEKSGIPPEGIRYILEDAYKFVSRETRRGSMYEGVILDPPAFGHGASKEIWRIEENLMNLLEMIPKILSKAPGSFFLLNGYAAGYAPQSLAQVVQSAFPGIAVEFGELHLEESGNGRRIPSGIYVRFARKR